MTDNESALGYRAGRIVQRLLNAVSTYSIAFAILAFGAMITMTFRYE